MKQLRPEHTDRLSLAVQELNAAMAQIKYDCGASVTVRPWANFSSDDGIPYVEVEITTGVQRFGQPAWLDHQAPEENVVSLPQVYVDNGDGTRTPYVP